MFFGSDFYGKTYNQIASLDETASAQEAVCFSRKSIFVCVTLNEEPLRLVYPE